MEKQELMNRYVYAVVRQLPAKQAADIEIELKGLIEDMLAERCPDRPTEEKDVRVVLTELGTPRELAAQYMPEQSRCLLEQPWYGQYRTVLKWVLPIIALGLLLSFIIRFFMDLIAGTATYFSVLLGLLEWIGVSLNAILGVTGALTILYAFLQRKKIAPPDMGNGIDGNFADLPPVPKKKETVGRSDAIADIVFSLLFFFIFLAIPEVLCAIFHQGKEVQVIPLLQTVVLRRHWYLIAAITACGVLSGVCKLLEGRYTLRLAIMTTATDFISLLLTGFFLATDGLLNPAFVQHFTQFSRKEDLFFHKLPFSLLSFFFLLLALAMALDIGVIWYRTIKYSKRQG